MTVICGTLCQTRVDYDCVCGTLCQTVVVLCVRLE